MIILLLLIIIVIVLKPFSGYLLRRPAGYEAHVQQVDRGRGVQRLVFHSIPVAIPPEGGIGGAAHTRSWYHSRLRPERLYAHRS